MSLLPNQSQVSPGESFWAPASGGGGGGGGIGPNPVVSSITVADGLITCSTVNGFVFVNTTTPVQDDAYIGEATIPLVAGAGAANVIQINSASGSANTLFLAAGDDNAAYINSGSAGSASGNQALLLQASAVYMSSLNVSSINGAAPGGGGGSIPGDLTVSSLTLAGDPTAIGAELSQRAVDGNLYSIGCVSSSVSRGEILLGNVGGRDQAYMSVGEIDQCFVSSLKGVSDPIVVGSGLTITGATNMGLSPVNISSLTVSSINSAAYPPPTGTTVVNSIVPFATGSGDGNLWTLTVPQNTGGLPIALTSTLTTNPSHTYLVSYSLVNGSNNDLTSITRLKVYTAGPTAIPIRAYPGDAADFTSGGMATGVSMLVSGASALRLQGENSSATTDTTLYFDQLNSVRITDLGV
jgi:hypothetical protein